MYPQPLPNTLIGRPRVLVAGRKPSAHPYPEFVEPTAPIEVEDLRYSTVRLRVPFNANYGPLWAIIERQKGLLAAVKGKGKPVWSVRNSVNFDLFFTLPVRELANPATRFDHLLVMFNGLNEIMPWHSALYDNLGHALAEQGIVSVLLPAPFHLNRTPQLPVRSETLTQLLKKPTDGRPKPIAPYLNFYQSFLELDALAALVHRDSDGGGKADPFGFYDRFGPRTLISLFGFSMGGLRALAKFLMESDEKKFNRCVLLCSGSRLEELSPPDVAPEWWREYARSIEGVRSDSLRASGVSDPEAFHQRLDAVFTKENFGDLRDNLKTRGSRIKAIFGGADEAVSSVAVRRLGDRANIETIHGMRHIVMTDPNFERDFLRVAGSIAAFLKLSLQEAPSRNAIRDNFLERLREKGRDVAAMTVDDLVAWSRADGALRGHYVSSKARFESDAMLVESVRREGDRRPIKPKR